MTIHIEVVPQPRPLLRQIRALGAAAGLSLNLSTPVETVEQYLDECDLVLVMSVNAGFGGQHFEPIALQKLRRLRTLAGPELLLSVDGGIHAENIGLCAEAGADIFITGTALFEQKDYRRTITEWTDLARSCRSVHV
jgi:ribulose-phosphate 3-epimerase